MNGENYSTYLLFEQKKELRKAFDVQGLILSATLSSNENTISRGYDVPMIAK